MAKLKLKFRDISRMSKKYPYTRHLPRTQLMSDKDFDMEVLVVEVSGTDEFYVEWETPFPAKPNVTATIAIDATGDNATAYETMVASMANVNVWIKSVTTAGCTLAFSDTFTGKVNVQAVRFS